MRRVLRSGESTAQKLHAAAVLSQYRNEPQGFWMYLDLWTSFHIAGARLRMPWLHFLWQAQYFRPLSFKIVTK